MYANSALLKSLWGGTWDFWGCGVWRCDVMSRSSGSWVEVWGLPGLCQSILWLLHQILILGVWRMHQHLKLKCLWMLGKACIVMSGWASGILGLQQQLWEWYLWHSHECHNPRFCSRTLHCNEMIAVLLFWCFSLLLYLFALYLVTDG